MTNTMRVGLGKHAALLWGSLALCAPGIDPIVTAMRNPGPAAANTQPGIKTIRLSLTEAKARAGQIPSRDRVAPRGAFG